MYFYSLFVASLALMVTIATAELIPGRILQPRVRRENVRHVRSPSGSHHVLHPAGMGRIAGARYARKAEKGVPSEGGVQMKGAGCVGIVMDKCLVFNDLGNRGIIPSVTLADNPIAATGVDGVATGNGNPMQVATYITPNGRTFVQLPTFANAAPSEDQAPMGEATVSGRQPIKRSAVARSSNRSGLGRALGRK